MKTQEKGMCLHARATKSSNPRRVFLSSRVEPTAVIAHHSNDCFKFVCSLIDAEENNIEEWRNHRRLRRSALKIESGSGAESSFTLDPELFYWFNVVGQYASTEEVWTNQNSSRTHFSQPTSSFQGLFSVGRAIFFCVKIFLIFAFQIHEWLRFAENAKPNLVKLEQIGHSYEKRPLLLVKVQLTGRAMI